MNSVNQAAGGSGEVVSGLCTTVFDVARYILHVKGRMSTMKLQKLCYYSQAWSLVWNDMPLFNEEFHAWENGPVCKELFHETQGKFLVGEEDEPKGDISRLTQEQRDTIDVVLRDYGDRDAQWLSMLTHLEEPWKNARRSGTDAIISKESMGLYYGSL